MGRKKPSFTPKLKNNEKNSIIKKISSSKRNEINYQCEKLLSLSSNPAYINKLWENYLETSDVIEKIKRLEEMKIESSKRSQLIKEFVKWLNENGAIFDGISISEFPGYGLGLSADINFQENQLILKIPRNLIFSTHTSAPELLSIKNDPLIQHMPQVALAISLLIEKYKDNSKWKPYIDILPTCYTTVLYMSTNDMMELKGSLTLESALRQCRNIARQYAYFNRMFQTTHNPVSEILRDVFCYEEYRWAVSAVMTRQNVVPSEDGSEEIHALIPLWDMCNHEEGKITTNFNKTSECCECFAMRDFKSGEQIFIYYGPRTNTDFFVHSGFVYPENKSDIFKLRLGVSKADPLQKERLELLERLNVPSIGEFVLKTDSEPISNLLLAFLRVFSMRKCDLDYWLKVNQVDHLLESECTLDPVVEESIKKFLETRLKLLIASYPSSQEDDEELIKSTLPATRKLAMQMRFCEKKILLDTLNYVENRWKNNNRNDADNNC